jgi:hypothetical protein
MSNDNIIEPINILNIKWNTFHITTPFAKISLDDLNSVLTDYYFGWYELTRISDTKIEIFYTFNISANDFHYAREKIINAIKLKMKNNM